MLEIPGSLLGIEDLQTLRYAKLWKIDRPDGELFYFTEHDASIVFDGQTYAPANGYSPSASRAESGMKVPNMEFVGILDDDRIQVEDIRAGLFHNSEVTEHMIDWMYPWAGAFYSMKYWISDITYDGEMWQAEIEGVARKLRASVGDIYCSDCSNRFCDAICDPGGTLITAATSSDVEIQKVHANEPRRVFWVFNSDLPGGVDDDYYNKGTCVGIDGENAGHEREIKRFTLGYLYSKVELYIQMPVDLAPADTVDMVRGCDKQVDTCYSRYNNLGQCRAFLHIPGTDAANTTPDAL